MPPGVDFLRKVCEGRVESERVVARGVRVREEILRGEFRLSDEIERALGGADGDGDELDARGVEDGLDVAPELDGQLPAEESSEAAHEHHDGALAGGAELVGEVDEDAVDGAVDHGPAEDGVRVGRGVGGELGEGARRGDRRGGRRAPHPRAATGGGRGRVSDTTRRRTGSERRAETTRKGGWNIGGSEPSGNGAGAKSRRGDGASAESDGRHRVGRVERRVADTEQRGGEAWIRGALE